VRSPETAAFLLAKTAKGIGHAGRPNLIQVFTNYEIGRRVVEHEQQGAKRAGRRNFPERSIGILIRIKPKRNTLLKI
jgi:hypothetical protein